LTQRGAEDRTVPRVPIEARIRGKERYLERSYPLICHLLDVAAMAGCVWDVIVGPAAARRIAGRLGVSEESVRGLVMFWAGLHDLGKISPVFQERIGGLEELARDGGFAYLPLNELSRKFSHDKATHRILTAMFAELGYSTGTRGAAQRVAQMLGGHHGTFHERLEISPLEDPWSSRPRELGGGQWRDQAQAHLQALARCIGPDAPVVPAARAGRETLAVVSGIVILADWLASQTSFIAAAEVGLNSKVDRSPRSGGDPLISRLPSGCITRSPRSGRHQDARRQHQRPDQGHISSLPGSTPHLRPIRHSTLQRGRRVHFSGRPQVAPLRRKRLRRLSIGEGCSSG
jgi:CRISPR-associated endonuclease Cas3-HD